MNITELAVNNGFTFKSTDEFFKPTNGWLGSTTYNPDVKLTKGCKKITISLQGGAMPNPPMKLWNEKQDIFKKVRAKYISLKDNDIILYESWLGELPSQELINEFIK